MSGRSGYGLGFGGSFSDSSLLLWVGLSLYHPSGFGKMIPILCLLIMENQMEKNMEHEMEAARNKDYMSYSLNSLRGGSIGDYNRGH